MKMLLAYGAIGGLVCSLCASLLMWKADHNALNARIVKAEANFADISSQMSELTSLSDKEDSDKNKLQALYDARMTQTDNIIDQRDGLNDKLEEVRRSNTILVAELEDSKTDVASLKYELSAEEALYKSASELEKQRAKDYNELLADYKQVCQQYSQPVDTSIHYDQLHGEAAIGVVPDQSSGGYAPEPPTHQFTVTPTGNGTATVSGY